MKFINTILLNVFLLLQTIFIHTSVLEPISILKQCYIKIAPDIFPANVLEAKRRALEGTTSATEIINIINSSPINPRFKPMWERLMVSRQKDRELSSLDTIEKLLSTEDKSRQATEEKFKILIAELLEKEQESRNDLALKNNCARAKIKQQLSTEATSLARKRELLYLELTQKLNGLPKQEAEFRQRLGDIERKERSMLEKTKKQCQLAVQNPWAKKPTEEKSDKDHYCPFKDYNPNTES